MYFTISTSHGGDRWGAEKSGMGSVDVVGRALIY